MEHLVTEKPNPNSHNLDELTSLQLVELMNSEDAYVSTAVGTQRVQIATAIDLLVPRVRLGGRLFYVGAGTSGRLGVLDAAECPPTFNSPPQMVVGIIAGGDVALRHAVEGAEDDSEQGAHDLQTAGFTELDTVVGIATSGRTPYVQGALRWARQIKSLTIGLSCNPESELHQIAELMITPVVGPEILSGSTRLKAGTATKMVLNMISTGLMVALGKTYGNRMVDLRATNVKLRDRSVRMVCEIAQVDRPTALDALQTCAGEVKTAIVLLRRQIPPDAARLALQSHAGSLRNALMDGNQ
ncbi:MAG: N-acetylmuramic acid 6-phosphate etherase [Planctomycetales bacterium]|nr:N-acetylmuramic acid 6-phosphate etherase [Planctomycetales bacterium]